MKIFLAGGSFSLPRVPRMTRVKYTQGQLGGISREKPPRDRARAGEGKGKNRGVQGPSICHRNDASPMSRHDGPISAQKCGEIWERDSGEEETGGQIEKSSLDKPEVCAGIARARAPERKLFFSTGEHLSFFFSPSSVDHSDKRKTSRTRRKGKLCRHRGGSDNF